VGEPLKQFIDEKAAEGSYQDSGGFVVDYSKARDKSRRYSLARPEQWVCRLLQGFSKLGVDSVDFRMTRKSLGAEAEVRAEDFHGFSELFRHQSTGNPEACFRDAVWGALGRGLVVELSWWAGDGRKGYRIDGDSIAALPIEIADRNKRFCFVVKANDQGGLLFKLFGKADFSPEFHEIAHAGFLAPYHLNLDGRAYDFESECAAQLLADSSEIRAKRAFGPPMIRTPHFLRHRVCDLKGQSDVPSFDYHFLLQIRWGDKLRAPRVHWVMDGVCIESYPIKEWGSPLWLDLYLPAEGLETDLTRLKLVETEERTVRLLQAERFVAYTLLTFPPLRARHEASSGVIEREVKRFADSVLKEDMALGLVRFKDQVEEHKNRLDMAREIHRLALQSWERSRQMSEGIAAAKAGHRSECEQRFDAVAGWGKLDVGQTEVEQQEFVEPMPERPQVKKFFGEVYVRLSGGTKENADRGWLKRSRKRR